MATQAAGAYGPPGQALPPGWEAKYDPGQRRYFYINHSTQTTSWEDPRPAYYRQVQQQQQQQNMHLARMQPSPRPSPQVSHQSAHHSPHVAPPHVAPQRSPRPAHTPQPQQSAGASSETYPMKEMPKPQWKKDVEDKYSLRVNTLQVDDEEEDAASSPATSRAPSPRPSSGRTEETSFSTPTPTPTAASIQVYEKVHEKVQKLWTMFPTADETIIKQFLTNNHNNENITITALQKAGFQRQDAASVQLMVNRIKRDFPSAEAGIIRDILHGVSNVESKARKELKSLGYQQSLTPNTTSSRKSSSVRGVSPNHAATPSPHNVSKKKSESRVSTPKEVSVADRKKLRAKIAAEFPDQSSSTIEMACDVCHYDEGRVRTLIQSMATTQQAKNIVSRMGLGVENEAGRSPSTRSPRQASPAPGTSTSAAPEIVFDFSNIGSDDIGSGTGSTTAFSTVQSTSAFSSRKMGTASNFTSKSMISSSVSKPSRIRTEGSSTMATIRPSQAIYSRDYGNNKSTNLSQPQGPNPVLPSGPDRGILIEEYLNNQGPDASNSSGPDPDLMSGPTTPKSGPDSDLSLGANPAIVSGPDMEIVTGPSNRGSVGCGPVPLRGGICNSFMSTFCWSGVSSRWGSTSV